ncbi:MAG: Rnf-Nqr domain containing protein, partial [Anaerovoracaceae bacterium]
VSDNGYNLKYSIIAATSAGLGVIFGLVFLAAIRYKVESSEFIPDSFKGVPIMLVATAILAVIFMGFSGVAVGLLS